MTRWFAPVVMFWVIGWSAHAGINHDSNLNWRTLDTEHFRIHYHDGLDEIAQRFWPLAEQVHTELSAYLNWVPYDKTDVVLTDEFDLSNGYARVFPRNTIVLYLSAPDDLNSLEDHKGWLDLVFAHEYLHVVHLDKVRGLPDGVQHVLGRHPLLFPNAYQPRWFIEGIATYIETDQEEGIGRGQSSFYNMMMRMEAQEQIKDVRRVNQPIASWPGGQIPYLYGVHFFQFLHEKYGAQSIPRLVENYSDNLIPFRINSNAASVTYKELPALWEEFNRYIKDKFAADFAHVEQAGLVEGKPLTHEGYQAGSLAMHGSDIYFYDFTGRTHPAIRRVHANGEVETLREVNRGARFTLHVQNGLLISQPERCRNARIYYDLYRMDLDGGNFQRLTHCARYRQAVWSADGTQIFAVHNAAGINRLLRLDEQAQQIEVLWQGEANEQIGQLAAGAGMLVAPIWRKDSGWNLEQFDLQNKSWRALTRDNAIQAHPAFSQDGQAIVYSADLDGIYNIYRYDLADGTHHKLTNVIGGAFHPALSGAQLAYVGYSARGFDAYVLDTAAMPVLAMPAPEQVAAEAQPTAGPESMLTFDMQPPTPEPVAGAPAAKAMQLPTRAYSPWRSLTPNWWTPYAFADDQRTVLGLSTIATDVLDRHIYSATLAYDFENSITQGSLDYFYDGLWPILHVGVSRDTSLTVDSNDNPVRLRTEDELILEAIFPFLSQRRNIFLHTALVKEKERDVWTNGVPALADFDEDFAGIALRYDSSRYYPLSVSRSEGRDLRLIYEDTDLYGNSDRKGQVTVAEWREFFHFGREHVLALRLAEGRGRNNPAPFRLGGIQDDDTVMSVLMVGERAPLFNKRDYSLRGYSEGNAQLVGINMRLVSAEYRFPIARIEHGWMAPPFGINQVHGTLFYDVGGVWDTGSGPDKHYAGAGFELNADLDIFYNFRINTSLGFATGLDDSLGEDKVYLRIGSHF